MIIAHDPPLIVPKFRQLSKAYRELVNSLSANQLLKLCVGYLDDYRIPSIQSWKTWNDVGRERLMRWHQALLFTALDVGCTEREFRSIYAMAVPFERAGAVGADVEIGYDRDAPAIHFIKSRYGLALANLTYVSEEEFTFDKVHVINDDIIIPLRLRNLPSGVMLYALHLVIGRIVAHCKGESLKKKLFDCTDIYRWAHPPGQATTAVGFNTLAQILRHDHPILLLNHFMEMRTDLSESSFFEISQLYSLAKRLGNHTVCKCISLLYSTSAIIETFVPEIPPPFPMHIFPSWKGSAPPTAVDENGCGRTRISANTYCLCGTCVTGGYYHPTGAFGFDYDLRDHALIPFHWVLFYTQYLDALALHPSDAINPAEISPLILDADTMTWRSALNEQ